ncbi:DJ-1/PfpI family protein [Bosea sp. CCNWLW174]|uniref:DJ-1/PfpI family protein n=1 Tax=Bosea sp. CCNWLW174 TaxID=3128896 RepID=UPI003FCC87BA
MAHDRYGAVRAVRDARRLWPRTGARASAGLRTRSVSKSGAGLTSSQGLPAGVHSSFAAAPQMDGLPVPGGQGTRREVDNLATLALSRRQSKRAAWMASVCTGAALLAKAGSAQSMKWIARWWSLSTASR